MNKKNKTEFNSVEMQDNTYRNRRYHSSDGVTLCERRKASEIRAK